MTVISIVGTSGVGKSFLVKQLAATTHSPALFEGEEGTIPREILENVFNSKDPTQRYNFFLNRYRTNLERAHIVSKAGLDCYVDCSVLTAKAVLDWEDKDNKYKLKEKVKKMEEVEADALILLIASKEFIKNKIKDRARETEQHDAALKRALGMQESFIKIAKNMKNVITLDRTNLHFENPDHIKLILDKIKYKSN